jgi:hypothetical protein
MTRNYGHTEQEYKKAAKDSTSFADMCRALGIFPGGGSYTSLKRAIARYEIDVSHFKRSSHNRGKYSEMASPKSKSTIKARLVRSRGHKCEWCLNSEWRGKPITLELEHVDGDTSHNDEANLLLLCPNCHATTPTWRRAKSSFLPNPRLVCPKCDGPKQARSKHCVSCRETPSKYDITPKEGPKTLKARGKRRYSTCACGASISIEAKRCVKCLHEGQKRIVWPPRAEVEALVASSSYVAAGRVLGVSDNAVRKFLRKPVEPTAPTESTNEKKDEESADV